MWNHITHHKGPTNLEQQDSAPQSEPDFTHYLFPSFTFSGPKDVARVWPLSAERGEHQVQGGHRGGGRGVRAEGRQGEGQAQGGARERSVSTNKWSTRLWSRFKTTQDIQNFGWKFGSSIDTKLQYYGTTGAVQQLYACLKIPNMTQDLGQKISIELHPWIHNCNHTKSEHGSIKMFWVETLLNGSSAVFTHCTESESEF